LAKNGKGIIMKKFLKILGALVLAAYGTAVSYPHEIVVFEVASFNQSSKIIVLRETCEGEKCACRCFPIVLSNQQMKSDAQCPDRFLQEIKGKVELSFSREAAREILSCPSPASSYTIRKVKKLSFLKRDQLSYLRHFSRGACGPVYVNMRWATIAGMSLYCGEEKVLGIVVDTVETLSFLNLFSLVNTVPGRLAVFGISRADFNIVKGYLDCVLCKKIELEAAHRNADLKALFTVFDWASNNRCAVCDMVGPKRCSRCKKAYYCSRACQKKHWKRHKTSCERYEAMKNDEEKE